VQHAILHGDEITGASTFQIETGLDTGPVYGIVTEKDPPNDTAGELLERLSTVVLTPARHMDGIARQPGRPPQPAAASRWRQDHRRRCASRLVGAGGAHRPSGAGLHSGPGRLDAVPGERIKLGPVRVLSDDSLPPGELRWPRNSVQVGTGTVPVEGSRCAAPGKRPIAAPGWPWRPAERGEPLVDQRASSPSSCSGE